MDATTKVAELPASRGASWLVESWRLFREAALTWIGLCVGWIVLTFGLMVIPLVGMVASNFLQPVFFASFAITAHKQRAGERIRMNDLFSGFRYHVRSQINLGALLLLVQLAALVLMALLGLPSASTPDRELTLGEYMEVLRGKEWILAVGVSLIMAVKLLVWFAPPLIAFHGMSTMQAIRWSVYATISNIGTMFVYATVLLGLYLVALIPWALGLIVVVPLTAISTYVSYREVFEAPPA